MRFIKVFFLFILGVLLTISLYSNRQPSFEERVMGQMKIEKIYYNHRIWPRENKSQKPPFEKIVSLEIIEKKVKDYLKRCVALEKYWNHRITEKELQEELERITKNTKSPEILKEIFDTFNNDAYLIAEFLVRPILADRFIRNWYEKDERFHKEVKESAEKAFQELKSGNLSFFPYGEYSKVVYKLSSQLNGDSFYPELEEGTIRLEEKEFFKIYNESGDIGKVSNLIEKDDAFLILKTIKKSDVEIVLECLVFRKKSLEEWLDSVDDEGLSLEASDYLYSLPSIRETSCSEGWDNGILNNTFDDREGFTAVWTGSEMIIWGGRNGEAKLNSGARYNPATDTWTPTSIVGAPEGRILHTAIWTGSEMIVSGGWKEGPDYSFIGGRYNPLTDSWVLISCPDIAYHSAIWTGQEMIIWGGIFWEGEFFTGARYNPATNQWYSMSTLNMPSPRRYPSVVWTGTEMVVWGGTYNGSEYNDGGLYNPTTNSWRPITTLNAPERRSSHVAVWTGSEMIVWGGVYYNSSNYQYYYLNTGGKYNPSTNSWTPINTLNALEGRYTSAIWTGSEMVIWGGYKYINNTKVYFNDGAKYNPATDNWAGVSMLNACSPRGSHALIWTGNEMIVYGGTDNSSILQDGARYNPTTDCWIPIKRPFSGEPNSRVGHSAIWTGSEMIVWGGYGGYYRLKNGGIYNLVTDSWSYPSTLNAPTGRSKHIAIWTGNDMVVWGGYDGDYTNNGGKYNPISDEWVSISSTNAPSPRAYMTAIWTGNEIIVWGGYGKNPAYKGDGGIYDVESNKWSLILPKANSPSARYDHSAIWTGNEMIVWGGANTNVLNDGAKYNPFLDLWEGISTQNAPSPRKGHSAIWTGKEMVVWGGFRNGNCLRDGGKYNPETDSWIPTSLTNAPQERYLHTAVWTGIDMIVWGGLSSNYQILNSGGKYNPSLNTWNNLSTFNVPQKRDSHTALWTGSKMIVWGGESVSSKALNDGGIYIVIYNPEPLTCGAADYEGCKDGGVIIEWNTPEVWGDGDSGTRSYDVLRNGIPVATNLPEKINFFIDTSGENGVTYLYQVRAKNGCGLTTVSDGVYATDYAGEAPQEVVLLSFYQNYFIWDTLTEADGYRLYRGTYSELPNLLNSYPEGCIIYEGTLNMYNHTSDDPTQVEKRLYWYLVTAKIGECEGSAGESSFGKRVLNSQGYCN